MADVVRVTLDITPKDGTIEDLVKILSDPKLLKRVAGYVTATEVSSAAAAVAVVAHPTGGYAHAHMDPENYGSCDICKQLSSKSAFKILV